MKLFLLLMCVYFTQLSAYQSFEVTDESNKIEVVSKPAYFVGELTQEEAFLKFKNRDFKPLPQKAESFGFSDAPVWIAVELTNYSDEKLFASILNASFDNVKLFIYYNDTIISTSQNTESTSLKQKELSSSTPGFQLQNIDEPVTYLFKITSLTPVFLALFIGDKTSIILAQLPEIIVFSIFAGSILSLFFYNAFIYFSTKELDYVYYTLYILFVFFLMLSIEEYIFPLLQFKLHIYEFFKMISLQGTLLLLLLFSLKFFNIKEISPKIYKASLVVGVITFFLLFISIYLGVTGQIISLIIVLAVNILCLYIGYIGYINGYAFSKYYLLGLSGFLAGVFISLGMINGILTYNIYTATAMLAGFVWEIIFFSLALGYKVKLLHIERNEALSKMYVQDKIFFLQSRQASVGELVGNIAHQWREPLAEIGSIQTNLKATLLFKGSIGKEKLMSAIDQSYNIIRHLSDTIDVFYRFFRHKSSSEEKFDVVEEIQNIQKMVHYSLEVENILLRCDCKQEIMAFGERSEFSNALLNIILNAKDALVERKITDPLILIGSYKNEEGVFITIEDNAGGIRQEPIEKIFNISVSSKKDSMGIGLFIAKEIIEQRMGGRLSVENRENGAVFTIVLPFSSEKSALGNESEFYDINNSLLKKISILEQKIAKSEDEEK